MDRDNRDAIAHVVKMWEHSPLAVEVTLAANLNAILSLVPGDELWLRQAAKTKPAKAADLLRAAEIVHQLLPDAG